MIKDQYGNATDTIYPQTPDKLLTPLNEEKLDKKKFKKVSLSNDDDWSAWDGNYYNIYDDNLENFVHTWGDHPRPSIMTIDLGQKVILSRIKVYQRSASETYWAYQHGNPKKYRIYGAKELPASDDLSSWILLRECVSVKPSGLPIGQTSNEDIEHFLEGDEYSFEIQEEIRYFRLAVDETWDGAGFITFSEISLWGSVIK